MTLTFLKAFWGKKKSLGFLYYFHRKCRDIEWVCLISMKGENAEQNLLTASQMDWRVDDRIDASCIICF